MRLLLFYEKNDCIKTQGVTSAKSTENYLLDDSQTITSVPLISVTVAR